MKRFFCWLRLHRWRYIENPIPLFSHRATYLCDVCGRWEEWYFSPVEPVRIDHGYVPAARAVP